MVLVKENSAWRKQKMKYKIYTSILIPYKWLTKWYAGYLFSDRMSPEKDQWGSSFQGPTTWRWPTTALSVRKKWIPLGRSSCAPGEGTGLGKQKRASKPSVKLGCLCAAPRLQNCLWGSRVQVMEQQSWLELLRVGRNVLVFYGTSIFMSYSWN